MLTLGGRADKNCESHFSSQESTAQTDSVTWPRSHRKAWVNIRSQASWWDCNVSGASVFLGCTQPCYLPLPTDTTSSLSSDELSPVYLWKPAPPLGRWIPAPLKDVVPVVALSCLYEVHFPPPISRQTRHNIPRTKKQTNPPLIPHPFHICLLSLLSLSHKKPQRLSTLHMSLLRQLQSPRLYLPKGLSSSPWSMFTFLNPQQHLSQLITPSWQCYLLLTLVTPSPGFPPPSATFPGSSSIHSLSPR